ncbi:MAG: MarR family transcriptional regulator [Proteobacteria bacterium]|nr:MarR family transcriptional regulator [Pseudomonadota bacterium]
MMLHRTLDAVMPEFRAIFSRFNLTEQQWRVLRVLWESDGLTLLDLSRQTLIPGPSLVGVIDRLERDQLVQRHRSTEDRRKVHIHTTPEGLTLQQEVSPLVEEVSTRLKDRLSVEAWQAMLTTLDQLVRDIQADGVESKALPNKEV